ncbi:hypothetical protein J0B02_03120 [Enterobacteriaceae bacterium YMB-R22]|uniref:hypothetical protein n=1 Tax=Tenebrionicola larvae TaxID=2815733 RepID=UPI0020139A50|nr:hypothetical protein [Tenebrionicola larvae]MBV4411832.1 hypothetical protein [Tenebrionicola larvae]
MNLTPEQDSVVRAQARKCIAEYKTLAAGVTGNRDALSRDVINKHHAVIKPICPCRTSFVIRIGYLTGALEERE